MKKLFLACLLIIAVVVVTAVALNVRKTPFTSETFVEKVKAERMKMEAATKEQTRTLPDATRDLAEKIQQIVDNYEARLKEEQEQTRRVAGWLGAVIEQSGKAEIEVPEQPPDNLTITIGIVKDGKLILKVSR